jgi:tetratricopeptide (TPR) repeat protein
LDETREIAASAEERSALIHREIFQLSALIVIAVAAFILTRAVAASNRDMSLRDAAEWFRRGQQAIQAGQIDEAIESLRRATIRNRDDKQYVLALAQALALKHDDAGARSVLLTLRESQPEDRDINLRLAELAAANQDVTEALRFYHNALYAPLSLEQASERRTVRLELVRFLLTHGQKGRAVSELLALSADMPDEARLHLDAAQLFVAANDEVHALEQFQRALRLDPDDRRAAAGAGEAAFRLGDYTLARSYLRRLPDDASEAQITRELVDLVLSRDPLATRIGSAERRRRLATDVAYVHERLRACIENGTSNEELVALESEARNFQAELTRPATADQDTVEAGVDLIDRAERGIATRCGPSTTVDQALVLIGRRHAAEAR